MSNRRFFAIAAILILGMSAGSWFIGHAGARGVVQTVDQGFYDAEQMKQPVPMQENQWNNGTYSNTKVNKNNVIFDIRDRLTVGSDLTITVQGGTWDWPAGVVNGNKISYTNSRGNVVYTDFDTILKEEIILNSPVRSIEWRLNLSMKPQSLGFQVDTDGYSIRDPTNENERIKIPFPFVIDAEGTRRDLRYSWNNGQRLLTLNLDDSGLVYPLTIDPTQTVDSVGIVGYWPIMLINATGYPMIVYGDSTNKDLKLAQNNSGTWSNSTINSNSYVTTVGYAWGATIDPTTGLPIIQHIGATDVDINITWNYGSVWKSQLIQSPAESDESYGQAPISISSSGGRVFSIIYNTTNGDINLTRLESLGNTITPYFTTINHALLSQGVSISGKKNTSNVLNFVYAPSAAGGGNSLNFTTVTDSSSPTINSFSPLSGFSLNNTVKQRVSLAINPLTDLPGIAYIPYASSGTDPSRYCRQINYSYLSGGKWYFEAAATNTSSPGISVMINVGLAYNSSGTPYIIYFEKTQTTGTSSPKLVNKIYRTGPNTWSAPETIDIVSSYNAPIIDFENSFVFDTSDNLHFAYHDTEVGDLLYYFETLPSAGAGSAPVASFILDKSAIIRNMTVTLTDQSSNTPTSWDFYSPGGNPCFTGNDTRQNPVIFPKWGGKCVVCEIATNAFGTDTSCEGSIWVARPQVTW